MSKSKRRKERGARASQPDLNQKALWFTVFFAALGAALAYYATNLTFNIESQGLVEASGCTLNEWINCDLANASSYAKLFGVPVAWFGFLFYIIAGLSALLGATTDNRGSSAPYIAISFVLAFGAVLFTFLKAYQLYDLGVLCIVCVGMYVANFGVAFSLGKGLGFGLGGWVAFLGTYVAAVRGKAETLGFSPKFVKVAGIVAVVFGIGYAVSLNQQRDITGTSGFDYDLAVNGHFRQVPIDVKTDANASVWGNPDAEITVVEFADFQCPACERSAFHLRPTLFEFRDDVKFIFMNYPLDKSINISMPSQIHTQAGNAAKAGVCAEEFGDFWGFHDELFRNQGILGSQLIARIAGDFGWDVGAFAQCVNRADVHERVLSDLASGRDAQVNSTPTLFINGRKVNQWRNTEVIRRIVREELSRQ